MAIRKKITLVYQDCSACGVHEKWAKGQFKLAEKLKYKIREIPFTHPDAQDLNTKAIELGKAKMPYFTDGEVFTQDLRDFEPKPKKEKVKKKKEQEQEEEEERKVDGDSSES